MSIALPDWTPPAKWDWLDRIITARRLLALSFLLGLLSIAAVAELSIKCGDEPIRILKLEDGSGFLVTEQKRRECRLALGNAFTVRF